MLMRQWLQQQAHGGTIPGLYWYDDRRTQIRIPWKHGSRTGWTVDDCRPYQAWAAYTGKIACVNETKKWKANFRCALNSLPDVREMTELCQKKGSDPFKVYELLPEVPRKSQTKKTPFKPKCEVKTEDSFDEFPVKEELDSSKYDLQRSFDYNNISNVNERVSFIQSSLADERVSFIQSSLADDSTCRIDLRTMTTMKTEITQSILPMIPTVVEEISESESKDPTFIFSSSALPVACLDGRPTFASSVQTHLFSQLSTSSSSSSSLLSFTDESDRRYGSEGRYVDNSSSCGSNEQCLSTLQVLNDADDLSDIVLEDIWTNNLLAIDASDLLLTGNEDIDLSLICSMTDGQRN